MTAMSLVWCLVHATACEDVRGGAIELSWKLRPSSSELTDKFLDCNSGKVGTNPVARIQLDWTVGEESGFATWSCNDSYGVTRFVLPEGETTLSVKPLCANDIPAEPASYIAPAPETRLVILGETVSLGAVELILQVTACDSQNCICAPRSE